MYLLLTSMSLLTFSQIGTTLEKVEQYRISPSKVDEDLIFVLAQLLLHHKSKANDSSNLISKEFEKNESTTFNIVEVSDCAFKETVSMVNNHITLTFGIAHKEASSYTILGIFCVFLAEAMQNIHGREYKYLPQLAVAKNNLPGQNPSADASLISEDEPEPDNVSAALVEAASSEHTTSIGELGNFFPRVLYECKPTLSPYLKLVSNKAMIESLLQANYCLRFYKLTSVLACVTDLVSWYYYQVESVSPEVSLSSVKMKITAYYKIEHSIPLQKDELVKHLSFLSHVLK